MTNWKLNKHIGNGSEYSGVKYHLKCRFKIFNEDYNGNLTKDMQQIGRVRKLY